MRPRALLLYGLAAVCAGAANPALTCASCHPKQSAAQPKTAMARALESGARSETLKSHPRMKFQQGGYAYTVERENDAAWYDVSGGGQRLRAQIAWSFGLGAAGQTFLLERGGAWYESRVSFYKDIDGLDLTVGARREEPRDLEEAFGRQLSARGALECFNCHASSEGGGPLSGATVRPEALTPGVQCRRCHERAAAHLAGFQNAGAAKTVPPRLGALSAEELSDFCGQCHRTWSQIASQGPRNVNNVRFQPYRLTNSKCYDASDARIRCVACHDPHNQLSHSAADYDARCAACHSKPGKPGAAACKVARRDCVSCHMPKVRIAEAHNAFTDHWIRIARPGAPYPN